MHYDDERRYYLKQREKYFESFRYFKKFDKVSKSRCDFYIERFKSEIKKTNNDKYYLLLLDTLNDYVKNNNFSFDESIYILVNFIDPELDMVKIYEFCCNKNELEKEIREEFGFYDHALIKVEKIYISKYKKKDDYIFEKNLELKHITTNLEKKDI